jgi:ABC-2 type transport system permease protein
MNLVLHQVRYEQKSYWRNPAGLFFTLGLPVLMLAIFSALNDAEFARRFVPGMLVFGIMNTAYGNLCARLVFRRETGLLKRAKATPVGPGILVAGMVASAAVMTAVVAAVVLAVGRLGYDVPLPTDWVRFVVVLLVGSASFAALGVGVAGFVPNVEAADPIAFATILPLQFISGIYQPVPAGSFLHRIADLFPVQHLFRAAVGGSGLGGHLAVVALWGVAGVVVAVRTFRWAPRR